MIRLVEISSRIIMRVFVWQTQLDLEHCFLSQWNILSIPAILASECRCWGWGLSCRAAWIVRETGAGTDSSEGAGCAAPSLLPKPRYCIRGSGLGEFQKKGNWRVWESASGKYPGQQTLFWRTLHVPRNLTGVSRQDSLAFSSNSCPLRYLHLVSSFRLSTD